jgi:pimeloyl-ACP methyl ester carboxylesterase
MKLKDTLALTAFGLAGIAAARVWGHYTRYRRRTTARLNAGSRIAYTARGPMEYGLVGDGPRVMFVHGALGGYDQSLALARMVHGFTIIAPSRPGHLRTPLSTGRSPAEQAGAYAALLDVLEVDRVAVVAGSGGGPSALEFVLRYPDRCWALGLVSALCLRPPPHTQRQYRFWAAIAPFDFLVWALDEIMVESLLLGNGTAPEVRRRLENEPETMEILNYVLKIYPTHSRAAGLRNDLAHANVALPILDLERITLPSLIIHGTADTVVLYENAVHAAAHIPGARLVSIEGGGHLCVATHRAEAIPPLTRFLHEHAPKDHHAHHLH